MIYVPYDPINRRGSFSGKSYHFHQKQTNDSYRFISELMDVFLMAGVHQQPEQSNYLAEGQTCKLLILRAKNPRKALQTFL